MIKKALVTGGGGFVGKAIVRRLLASGIETRVIGRSVYPDIKSLGAQCWQGDIVDTDLVRQAARGVDVVFHTAALAGIWGPWEWYHHTNVVGTESVLSACQYENIPNLVYTSTPSVVFNSEDIENGDENLPYGRNVLCNYAKSKIIAEKAVLSASNSSLATCALRPHLIWGPGDPHLLPRLIEAGRQKKLKIVGNADNLVDISYIENVAEAHVLAAIALADQGRAAGKAYFISQESPVNLWDWINNLFEMVGVETITSSVSFARAYRAGALLETVHKLFKLKGEPRMTRFLAEQLAKSHYFSTAKANTDFGYRPTISTEEGLQHTVQWLKTL